jgi:hypothetical protein
MGLIAMSERDLQRIEVLSKVIAGRMTSITWISDQRWRLVRGSAPSAQPPFELVQQAEGASKNRQIDRCK